MRSSNSRQWPGERHPTRWDVHDANQSPAATFLDRFRAALLHSECPEETSLLETSDSVIDGSESVTTDTCRYTYPMVLLSDVPVIPPEPELARLQEAFSTSFKKHIFISNIDILDPSFGSHPPYLQLAIASMSATTSPNMSPYAMVVGTSQGEMAAELYDAGVNLWCVMLEVDNREARLFEAVVAASLLATYGILSADRRHWRKVSPILCNAVTISRRLHLTDGYSLLYAPGDVPDKDVAMKSALISYMLLIDTMQAAYCGLAPNLSTGEFFVRMPSTSHQFRNVYNSLLQGYKVPPDIRTREDALLLLTALLSDIVYIQHCHLPLASVFSRRRPTHDNSKGRRSNPFAPLTSRSEYSRLVAEMKAALLRWEALFQANISSDLLALYSFCQLQLVCPDMWKLPQMAGFGEPGLNGHQQSGLSQHFEVPESAMHLPWLILDYCGKSSKSAETRLSMWQPIILFLSSLVVWQKLRAQPASDLRYGSLTVLTMFKNEIAQLPWPCCTEMAKTLDRLMEK